MSSSSAAKNYLSFFSFALAFFFNLLLVLRCGKAEYQNYLMMGNLFGLHCDSMALVVKRILESQCCHPVL